MFEKIKSWFKNSATIVIARLTMLVGFITTVCASIDWSPLTMMNLSSGFDWKQALQIGIGLFLQGVLIELARRRSM